MCSLSHPWDGFQQCLFDVPEEAFPDGLTRLHGQFMWLLEVVPVRRFVDSPWRLGRGRRPKDRRALLRAFLAKAWFNFPTTVALRDRLLVDRTLRQLCGWEQRREVPSEATFSRAFAAFARSKVGDELHAALVAAHATKLLFWHVSRDSTPIPARERPQPPDPAPAEPAPPKRQRGRPRKGEEPPAPPPSRLQQQYAAPEQTAQQLAELPRECDWGCKQNAAGKKVSWKGYKLHVDTGDEGLPLLAVTTSASLHDSQTAIPMARTTAQRVTSLYDLMDSAYDAELIWHTSYDLQHVPIIAENPRRGGPPLPMEPDRAERFKKRSGAERFNSLLKDCHGGRTVRVRGATKVHAHLMYGVLAIFVRVLAGWPDG